jgi:hypothetical protein
MSASKDMQGRNEQMVDFPCEGGYNAQGKKDDHDDE